jgi:hypothetical protein
MIYEFLIREFKKSAEELHPSVEEGRRPQALIGA